MIFLLRLFLECINVTIFSKFEFCELLSYFDAHKYPKSLLYMYHISEKCKMYHMTNSTFSAFEPSVSLTANWSHGKIIMPHKILQ